MSDPYAFYPPNHPPIDGKGITDPPKGQHLSFEAVQDRLVEAVLTCWRYPDRERGWQTLRSAWPEITRDRLAGDYDARGGDGTSAPLVTAAMTREDVVEMEEAFGWLADVDAEDRKLIGRAIVQLARGKREVSWVEMLGRIGLDHGADGLRMRYARAINAICIARSRRNPSPNVSTG